MSTTTQYSVPSFSAETLCALVSDSRLQIPEVVKQEVEKVKYKGSPHPFLPVPWKFTEAIAALKGLEAAFAMAIAKDRYGPDFTTGSATIDTDHAALFVFSAFTTTINGKNTLDPSLRDDKDAQYFHLHGSMNGQLSQQMVGVDPERIDITDTDEILKIYGAAVAKFDAEELDSLANDRFGQAGTICYNHREFLQLEHGKAIAEIPVYELQTATPGPPTRWPAATTDKALSGIKVLELTRIIAAPAVGRGLAEHGATVLRITSDTIPDMHVLTPDLSQGKYNASLDLKTESGKATLRTLIKDSDVLIDGLGFGRSAVRALKPNVIYVRENTYGWHGPWSGRSGWQQIADCLVGISSGFGEKLGLGGEPVVPIFPNSDYGTGVIGVIGVMHALLLRAQQGGAYNLDIALAYYNVWLAQLGYYPDEIWNTIKPRAPYRHNWDMVMMLSAAVPQMITDFTERGRPG